MARGSFELGILPVDSFIDKIWDREGELAMGGTLGARLVDDALP